MSIIDPSELNLETEGTSRFRELQGFAKLLRTVIGVIAPLSGLLFILDVPYYLVGVSLFPNNF